MRIVVSGIGIAGPTLAYWLRRSGHEVVLVESAPALRSGGYIVDFWGLGYDIAEKMGVIAEVRERGYQVREVRYVDRRGRTRGKFGTEVFGRLTNNRFTSLRRSDLSAVITGALDGVEMIFGDSIAAIAESRERVHVTFEHAAPRDADLVIGADGLHSRVRQLVFGPQDAFEHSLDYHVAACEVGGYQPREELVYISHGVAGRQVSRFSMRDDRTLFLFVFRDEYLRGRTTATDDDRKAALRDVFADVGWECPGILAATSRAPNIYFDRVSQIRMPQWTRGRVALLGDAAACVSLLAGEGTGLAMAEAYVLAGALRQAGGDHAAAFARYEATLRSFLQRKQASAAKLASTFAPRTNAGVAFRNAMTSLLRIPAVANHFIGRDLRDDIDLSPFDA